MSRKTNKVRIQLDLIVNLDEPINSIHFGSEWCNNAAEAVVIEIAKKNPGLVLGTGIGNFDVRLDFRKNKPEAG